MNFGVHSQIVPIFATAGNNAAIDEILLHGRFEGAIRTIAGLVKLVDEGSVMFISFVSFLIICVAIWRNVLAGAYAAYPKFWDAVHVAHEDGKDQGWIDRMKGIPQNMHSYNFGTIKILIMRILPDIKVLTDFEDDTVEPKTYFTKAIIQMLGVVMIGIFIYNGYYRDTTVMVGSFASELFTRAVVQVDPVAIWDKVMSTAGTPDFTDDNAKTFKEKNMNAVKKNMYKKIIGKYSDITSASAKADLAGKVEEFVTAWVSESTGAIGRLIGNEDYDMSLQFNFTTKVSPQQGSTSKDGLIETSIFSRNIKDFNLHSNLFVDETWYITCVATFTKKDANFIDLDFADVTMKISINSSEQDGKTRFIAGAASTNTVKLKAYQSGAIIIGSKQFTATVANGNTLVINASRSELNNAGLTADVDYKLKGIHYQVGKRDYTIANVRFSNVEAVTFMSPTVGSSTWFPWNSEIKTTN